MIGQDFGTEMRLGYALLMASDPELCLARHAIKSGYSVNELRSDRRARNLVKARWGCIKEMRDDLNMSLPEIGRVMNRDHTTILHALRSMSV